MYEEVLSFTASVLSFTSPMSGGFTWSLLACLSVTFVLLLLYLSSFFIELLVPEMMDWQLLFSLNSWYYFRCDTGTSKFSNMLMLTQCVRKDEVYRAPGRYISKALVPSDAVNSSLRILPDLFLMVTWIILSGSVFLQYCSISYHLILKLPFEFLSKNENSEIQ